MVTDSYVLALLKLVPKIASHLGLQNLDGMPFEEAFRRVAEAILKRNLEILEDRDKYLAGSVSSIIDAHRVDGRGLFEA